MSGGAEEFVIYMELTHYGIVFKVINFWLNAIGNVTVLIMECVSGIIDNIISSITSNKLCGRKLREFYIVFALDDSLISEKGALSNNNIIINRLVE